MQKIDQSSEAMQVLQLPKFESDKDISARKFSIDEIIRPYYSIIMEYLQNIYKMNIHLSLSILTDF